MDIEQMLKDMDQFPKRFPSEEVSSQLREMLVYALNQKIVENGLELRVMETPGNFATIFRLRGKGVQ